MGRIAFVFSGQGDQYPGMGKELAERYPAAKAVFDMCDRIRPGTSAQCFGGAEEELKRTVNTQPCLFAVELAGAEVLLKNGIKPDAVAGYSLGEVVACTVAGAVDYETGFRIVCKRGELMQQAAEQYDTTMAAVVKLTHAQVEELCKGFPDMYAVNFNAPGHVSVAGAAERMPEFFAAVKAAGGRAIPVKVKGAFHSPFMNGAAEAFRRELENTAFQKRSIELYSNVTAQPYTDDTADLLARQVCSPVRWEAQVRGMIAAGVDTFIEVGPGKTLTGIIGKIDPDVKRYCVAELSTVLAEVKPC